MDRSKGNMFLLYVNRAIKSQTDYAIDMHRFRETLHVCVLTTVTRRYFWANPGRMFIYSGIGCEIRCFRDENPFVTYSVGVFTFFPPFPLEYCLKFWFSPHTIQTQCDCYVSTYFVLALVEKAILLSVITSSAKSQRLVWWKTSNELVWACLGSSVSARWMTFCFLLRG